MKAVRCWLFISFLGLALIGCGKIDSPETSVAAPSTSPDFTNSIWTLDSPTPNTLSNNENPQFLGSGLPLSSGFYVNIYDSSNCATVIGTAVVAGGNAVVSDVSYLTDGTQDGIKNFYGKIFSAGGSGSDCRDLGLSYTLDTQAPAAFTITGASGASDITADDVLSGVLEVTANWTDTTGESSYDVAIYQSDGSTVQCPSVNKPANSTSHVFTGCTLVNGQEYNIKVVANDAADNFTEATNNMFVFTVSVGVLPSLSIGDIITDGAGVASVPVTLSAASTVDITFEYYTTSGTAAADGTVFSEIVTATAVIPAGQTTVLLPVSVLGSVDIQSGQTFFVNLVNPIGASIAVPTAQVTVVNSSATNVLTNFAQVAAGTEHTCALLASGAVKCWGYNSNGQIGDNTSGSIRLVPTDVTGLSSGVTSIAAGAYHTCALLTTGAVKCWGKNSSGQIGNNSSGVNKLVPTDVSGLNSVHAITAGGTHTCALLNSGNVKCWGGNSTGQIGDGTSGTNRLIPANINSLSGVSSIMAGGSHTCALLSTGAVKCWGSNKSGQVGDNTSGTNRLVPTSVSNLSSGVSSISTGGNHSCALLTTGAVQCWGSNSAGQIGNNSSGTNKLIPTNVTGLSSGVSGIVAGGSHTCALTSTGGVKCWGSNLYGQIGDNTNGTNRLLPTDVSGLGSGVGAITAGGSHNCAVISTGAIKCWGRNLYGQIGDNTSGGSGLVPTDVNSLGSGVSSVVGGGSHSCALSNSGAVKCWGSNLNGQIGDNTSGTDKLVPTDVSGLSSGVSSIAAGGSHTCALMSTGSVKCWGSNKYGQIGNNTSGTNKLVPTDVSGLSSGVSSIAAGGSHTCALMSTGAVKCWGSNKYGQIGNNASGTNKLVPTDVSGLSSGVSAIAAGGSHTCALMNTGAVKCWGYNRYGQIGNNATSNKLVPTDVSGLSTDVSAITVGANHSCALLTTGAVKCWGYNNKGQIGDSTITNRLVPTAVVGLNMGVTGVGAGANHTCALLSTGAVKCWGSSLFEQIGGDANGVDAHSSIAVSRLSSGVSSITIGSNHGCALLVGTGGLKCWGYNGNGQIGSAYTNLIPQFVRGL